MTRWRRHWIPLRQSGESRRGMSTHPCRDVLQRKPRFLVGPSSACNWLWERRITRACMAGILLKSSSCSSAFSPRCNWDGPLPRLSNPCLDSSNSGSPRHTTASGCTRCASFSRASMRSGFTPWAFQILVFPWCKQMPALVRRCSPNAARHSSCPEGCSCGRCPRIS